MAIEFEVHKFEVEALKAFLKFFGFVDIKFLD